MCECLLFKTASSVWVSMDRGFRSLSVSNRKQDIHSNALSGNSSESKCTHGTRKMGSLLPPPKETIAVSFWVIRCPVSTSKLPVKILEALDSCFIPDKDHPKCVCVAQYWPENLRGKIVSRIQRRTQELYRVLLMFNYSLSISPGSFMSQALDLFDHLVVHLPPQPLLVPEIWMRTGGDPYQKRNR